MIKLYIFLEVINLRDIKDINWRLVLKIADKYKFIIICFLLCYILNFLAK